VALVGGDSTVAGLERLASNLAEVCGKMVANPCYLVRHVPVIGRQVWLRCRCGLIERLRLGAGRFTDLTSAGFTRRPTFQGRPGSCHFV